MRSFSYPGLILIMPFFFILSMVNAQEVGCTDSQAENYNSEANINDGSCLYAPTNFKLEVLVDALPEKVRETSGLIYWNGGLWTINDSQNLPEIYKIDTLTGEVLQTILFQGAENIDWEDIDQDDEHIYVGDIGNNLGTRTDLKIYYIQKTAIPDSGDVSVKPDAINFSYGDQTSFRRLNRRNNFDCEALLSFGDSLYIFSKNWGDLQTRLYVLPKIAGTYVVYPLDSMNADGLITGANINEKGEIVLIGYKNYNPFMWLLFDFKGNDFFGGNKRRVDFPGMLGIQAEGICYTFNRNVFISAEKTAIGPARLFKLNTTPWMSSYSNGMEDMIEPSDGQGMLIYPNPNNGNFTIEIEPPCISNPVFTELYTASGSLIGRSNDYAWNCKTDLRYPEVPNGLYLLRCYAGTQVYNSRFLVINDGN